MNNEIFKQIEINELKIIKKKIELCSFRYKNLDLELIKLSEKELQALYQFFIKFDDDEKVFFPFPLFKPIDITFEELKQKYKNYLSENTRVYFVLLLKNKLIGLTLLKKIGFIKTGYHHSYIQINNSIMGYCRKLGNYLFDTWYCQESFKRNTHYFGDHNSYNHYKAAQERKQISNKTLN